MEIHSIHRSDPERLSTLLDHPAIVGAAESLLGPEFNYVSSDGGLKRDDSNWHSDGSWSEHPDLRKIKMVVYLEVLDANSGCMRVIPGSHRVGDGFAEGLERHAKNIAERPFGIDSPEWPSVALATRPGDVVIFNQHLKHSSFFGGIRRRLFSLIFCEHARSEAQVEQLRKYLLFHIAAWGDTVYGEIMLRNAGAERMSHLRQVLEHQHVIPASRSGSPVTSVAASS